MLNQVDLESLISSLRRELEHIEQAIRSLEQMVRHEPVETRDPDRRTSERNTATGKIRKAWSHHDSVRR